MDFLQASEKSNSVGLLRKIILMDEKNRLDFFDYVNKYKLSQCAILKLRNGFFQISSCFGFDSQSILKSVSTEDFWKGLIPKNNTPYLFTRSDNSIQPLYQFFSETIIDSISSIILYKNNSDVILLASSESIEKLMKDKAFFKSFNELDTYDVKYAFSSNPADLFEVSSSKNKYTSFCIFTIELSESINDFMLNNKQNLTEAQETHFRQVIFYNVYYTLKKCFPEHRLEETETTIKLFIPAEYNLPEKMLTKHLKLLLKEILGESSLKIKITQADN